MNRRAISVFALLLACFALLAGGTTLAQDDVRASAAVLADKYIPGEPNDTMATATPLVSHEFSWDPYPNATSDEAFLMTAGDVDFYRYEMPVAADLEARTRVQPAGQLALLDASGNQLAQDSSCGEGEPRTLVVFTTLPAGTYYLRVTSCPGETDPDVGYYVHVGLWNFVLDVEPNDSRPTAAPLFDGGMGAITPAGDRDFYRTDMNRGQAVELEIYNQGIDAELVVLSLDGDQLATATNGFVYFVAPETDGYILRVRSATHPTGEGGYLLRVNWWPYQEEQEPNDLPAQATLVSISDFAETPDYGWSHHAELGISDPVDYFTFDGEAGNYILVSCDQGWDTGYVCSDEIDLQLFDAAMQPVALDAYQSAMLPATGTYLVRASYTDLSPYDDSIDYALVVSHREPDEPNDSFAQATPVEPGVPHYTAFLPTGWPAEPDRDFYRFEARVGDVIQTNSIDNAGLYDSQGNLVAASNPWPWGYGSDTDLAYLVPADGIYYLSVFDERYDDQGNPMLGGYYTVNIKRSGLFVSGDLNGFDGIGAHRDEDIVTRDPDTVTWTLVFDGTDVGITRDVAAFEFMPNGSILMSLDAAQTVPGLGKVLPQDIIRFLPTALGDTTQGTFEWYLDGSDVGLTTSGEKIDAIAVKISRFETGPVLFVSTFANASVPRPNGGTLNAADEDLIAFVPTQLGANTQGGWRIEWDGSTVQGMAPEDVNAATSIMARTPKRAGEFALSFRDGFAFGPVKGTYKDVVHGAYDSPTDLSVAMSIKNLLPKRIDGLSVGPGSPP